MCDDPLIYPGHAMQKVKAQPTWSPPNSPPAYRDMSEQKGGLRIRDLWQIGTDSIHNMRVVNNGTISHQINFPYKCAHMTEMGGKQKYQVFCLYQRSHFSPFTISAGAFLGVEAEGELKCIASCLKMKQKQRLL